MPEPIVLLLWIILLLLSLVAWVSREAVYGICLTVPALILTLWLSIYWATPWEIKVLAEEKVEIVEDTAVLVVNGNPVNMNAVFTRQFNGGEKFKVTQRNGRCYFGISPDRKYPYYFEELP